MALFKAYLILVFIGVCRGINRNPFDDFTWDNLKNPINGVYNNVADQTNTAHGDVHDYFEHMRKRMLPGRSTTPLDYNSVVETTLIRTSGVINNEITITVLSYYQLDVLWTTIKDDIETFSFGDIEQGDNVYISSYTVGLHEVMHSNKLSCHISLNKHFINIEFKGNTLFTASSQHLGQLGLMFSGPYSKELQNDGTFEFDVELSSDKQNGISVEYAYFNTNHILDEDIVFDSVRFETEENRGKTHVTAKLEDFKYGEFLIVYNSADNAENFNIFAAHRIDIPRNEVPVEDKVSFTHSFNEVFRFSENIRYGALYCFAIGQPMPQLEVLKDGVLLPVVSLPQLRVATLSFVSFDGRTIDEVAGAYVCRATSGNQTIEREILVEGL